MDQLSEEITSERLRQILQIQDEITEIKNKSLEGTLQEVIIEGESKKDREKLTGRTRTNKIVNIQIVTTPKVDIEGGSLINVEITRGRQHSLEGVPIK
jgi:tRNA-2-methylthio-N6-dimethylallyladenosine synthase